MKIIHIFTCATSIYKEYLKYQIQTINNIPFEKTYNIISDAEKEYKNCFNYHICDLPYPLVTLNKFNYCNDICNLQKYDDNDYFLFLDADAFICKKDIEFWNKLFIDLENYELLVSNNTFYYKCEYNNNLNYKSSSYIKIPNKDLFSTTAMLLGKIYVLKLLNKDINKLLYKDLNKNFIIANVAEESYFNKIINNIYTDINNSTYKYKIKFDYYNIFLKSIDEKLELNFDNDFYNIDNIIEKYNLNKNTFIVKDYNYNLKKNKKLNLI